MASSRSWYSMTAKNQDAEILIYDEIGFFGITAKDFNTDLKALGNPKNLTVRINSPGGETPDGSAIYNMLKRQKTKSHITVFIDGLAASMASLIAMVGDEVIMPRNALMMIHDPAGVVVGNSSDMRALAQLLEKVKGGMVQAYSEKSGQSPEDIEDIMSSETWFTAQEAVDAGFADKVEDPIKIAAGFDLSKFRNPPDDDYAAPPTARKRIMKGPTMAKDDEVDIGALVASEIAKQMPALTAAIGEAVTKAFAAAPKPAAAAAAVTETVETPAVMEARIRGEVKAHSDEITALCALAKKPGMAKTYIAANLSIPAVKALLDLEEGTTEGGAGKPNAAAKAALIASQQQATTGVIDSSAIWARHNGKVQGIRAA